MLFQPATVISILRKLAYGKTLTSLLHPILLSFSEVISVPLLSVLNFGLVFQLALVRKLVYITAEPAFIVKRTC